MKKTLLGAAFLISALSPAMAADVVIVEPAPPTPVASTYNWSGVYVGVQAGYSWGSGDGAYLDPTGFRDETANPEADGFLLGGQIGYNYQWGAFVLGVEGDLAYSWADGDSDIDTFPDGVQIPGVHNENEYNYLASITGRLGYAFDRTLIYAKGGVGFTELEMSDVGPGSFVTASGSKSMTGWTIGGGVEYAITDQWTAKGEYQFYRFSDSVSLNDPNPWRVYDDNFDIHALKIGFNYHF